MLFLIGAAFGLRRGAGPSDVRLIACAVTANALVGIGLPAVCYAFYPAWMWGYLVDPARVPLWIVVTIFTLYWVPFAVGYRTHSWRALAVGLLAQIGLIALTWPRYRTVTTMDGFAAGVEVPPGSIPLVFQGGLVAVAAVIILVAIARRRAPH